MPVSSHRETLAALLSDGGFLAADEEAGELLASAAGDVELLDSFVRRRLTGEPLAWITGSVSFCGIEIHIAPGVYVPRPQSEPLARRALERLTATPRFLRRGGALLLELGGQQAAVLRDDLERLGYLDVTVLADEEGDVRGLEATFGGSPSVGRPHRAHAHA